MHVGFLYLIFAMVNYYLSIIMYIIIVVNKFSAQRRYKDIIFWKDNATEEPL